MFFFCDLLIVISGLFAGIVLSVWIEKSHKIVALSVSTIFCGLYLYQFLPMNYYDDDESWIILMNYYYELLRIIIIIIIIITKWIIGTFLMQSSSCNNKVLRFIVMLSFTIIKSRKVLEDLELRFLNPRKLKITYGIKANLNMLDSRKNFLKHYLVFDCKEAWTSFKFKNFY